MSYPEIDRLVNRYRDLSACRHDIERSVNLLGDNYGRGGLLLACGTGASSATADQLVTGLLKGFQRTRPVPQALRKRLNDDHGQAGEALANGLQGALPALALSGPASLQSGVAASAAPELVFAQLVAAYGRAGDTLLVLAADGANASLSAALRVAGSLGLTRIVLAGREDDDFQGIAECVIRVPRVTSREIQELHLPVCNAFITILEQEFFS